MLKCFTQCFATLCSLHLPLPPFPYSTLSHPLPFPPAFFPPPQPAPPSPRPGRLLHVNVRVAVATNHDTGTIALSCHVKAQAQACRVAVRGLALTA